MYGHLLILVDSCNSATNCLGGVVSDLSSYLTSLASNFANTATNVAVDALPDNGLQLTANSNTDTRYFVSIDADTFSKVSLSFLLCFFDNVLTVHHRTSTISCKTSTPMLRSSSRSLVVTSHSLVDLCQAYLLRTFCTTSLGQGLFSR